MKKIFLFIGLINGFYGSDLNQNINNIINEHSMGSQYDSPKQNLKIANQTYISFLESNDPNNSSQQDTSVLMEKQNMDNGENEVDISLKDPSINSMNIHIIEEKDPSQEPIFIQKDSIINENNEEDILNNIISSNNKNNVQENPMYSNILSLSKSPINSDHIIDSKTQSPNKPIIQNHSMGNLLLQNQPINSHSGSGDFEKVESHSVELKSSDNNQQNSLIQQPIYRHSEELLDINPEQLLDPNQFISNFQEMFNKRIQNQIFPMEKLIEGQNNLENQPQKNDEEIVLDNNFILSTFQKFYEHYQQYEGYQQYEQEQLQNQELHQSSVLSNNLMNKLIKDDLLMDHQNITTQSAPIEFLRPNNNKNNFIPQNLETHNTSQNLLMDHQNITTQSAPIEILRPNNNRNNFIPQNLETHNTSQNTSFIKKPTFDINQNLLNYSNIPNIDTSFNEFKVKNNKKLHKKSNINNTTRQEQNNKITEETNKTQTTTPTVQKKSNIFKFVGIVLGAIGITGLSYKLYKNNKSKKTKSKNQLNNNSSLQNKTNKHLTIKESNKEFLEEIGVIV